MKEYEWVTILILSPYIISEFSGNFLPLCNVFKLLLVVCCLLFVVVVVVVVSFLLAFFLRRWRMMMRKVLTTI